MMELSLGTLVGGDREVALIDNLLALLEGVLLGVGSSYKVLEGRWFECF